MTYPRELSVNLWLEFSEHGHCGLCGNQGIVDTKGSAVTAAGVDVGVRAYCICPNGRAMKGDKPTMIEWISEDGSTESA